MKVQDIPLPVYLQQPIATGEIPVFNQEPSDGISGVLTLPESPALIASYPILSGKTKDHAHGTLLIGRFLDSSEVRRISDTINCMLEQIETSQKALRESKQKFRTLAEESPNMIFINKSGRVVYANKRCEDIMGYSRSDYYAEEFDFFTLIAPE
jgi:sensor domain CHASE-containing protein